MSKITTIKKSDGPRRPVRPAAVNRVFQPCSPDMTICGDCEDNRAKKKCPRLKEWLAKNAG